MTRDVCDATSAMTAKNTLMRERYPKQRHTRHTSQPIEARSRPLTLPQAQRTRYLVDALRCDVPNTLKARDFRHPHEPKIRARSTPGSHEWADLTLWGSEFSTDPPGLGLSSSLAGADFLEMSP